MLRKIHVVLLGAVLVATVVRPARAELTADQVRESIERGKRYLLSEQSTTKGDWTLKQTGYEGGVTSLCTLALINSGVEIKDPAIQRALNYLRGLKKPDMTYVAALQTMVFCAADADEKGKDRHLIRRNVEWLESIQLKSGPRTGAWNYGVRGGGGDNSNAQFALLALHEASRIGIPVREDTWRSALNYWIDMSHQKADGSWGYFAGEAATGSMTCAGIASLIITMEKLPEYHRDAMVVGESVSCCGKQNDAGKLELAIQWLGKKFRPSSNPSSRGELGAVNLLYYLYGVERVGRLSGRRFLGKHDWYRAGAEFLIGGGRQDAITGRWKGQGHAEGNPLIATSFALLFLSKGRRPVLMAKYKHTDDTDWDLHRSGVKNLTRAVEKSWKRDLTWQTIEGRAATVDDLLQTPVLFISGRNSLDLDREQKENLRKYVNQGGFIFAENCCDGTEFDEKFRKLMQEIFPDSALRLLSEDHPIWYAEGKVNPKYMRPLYGIDACCRTSVIYCPKNLSCYWELDREGAATAYPKTVQDEVEACIATGKNVLAYATNREVQDKLARPRVSISDSSLDRTRDTIFMPKLKHSGGDNDAPNAWPNLLRLAAAQLQMRIQPEKMLATDDPRLLDYPIVFIHGRRNFRFTSSQRKAIATYIQRGGFILADSICASSEFSKSFRNEMKMIFPDAKLEPLSGDHPLLTDEFRGYDLKTVMLRRPQARTDDAPLKARLTRAAPQLEGLVIDDRLAVVFSPIDISCALENHASLDCESYEKSDATKIGINVILYALQQ